MLYLFRRLVLGGSDGPDPVGDHDLGMQDPVLPTSGRFFAVISARPLPGLDRLLPDALSADGTHQW
jgi:hypothetical protein